MNNNANKVQKVQPAITSKKNIPNNNPEKDTFEILYKMVTLNSKYHHR
jgi:hypothetical protein